MKKKIITTAAIALTFCGCKKAIDIDYTTISPLYVIEANLCSDSCSVLITKTLDMDALLSYDTISSAEVAIIENNQLTYPLNATDSGTYTLQTALTVTQGEKYTLELTIDGEKFTSTETAPPAPVIGKVTFTQQQLSADFSMTFCNFSIIDTPSEKSYYRYRVQFFNNENRSNNNDWSLIKETIDSEPIPIFTPLISSQNGEILQGEDGDSVTIEVQAISKEVYDYFDALNLSSSSNANPPSNINGGTLGYFSAYSQTTHQTQFFAGDIGK